LLRCVLEVFTYWKILDHEKFLYDFNLPQNAVIEKAVLVFEGSQPHNDWLDGNQPYVKELMKQLGVGLYVLDNGTNLNVVYP
jgi:hypothetical protein